MSSRQSSNSPVVIVNRLSSVLKPEGLVPDNRISAILANRQYKQAEQYLIRWKNNSDRVLPTDALSWHTIPELENSFCRLQQYLESRCQSSSKNVESPNEEYQIAPAASYNGSLKVRNGEFDIVPWQKEIAVDATRLPTPAMIQTSLKSTTSHLEYCIRTLVAERLKNLPGPPVTCLNIYDSSSLPLSFQFVSEQIIRPGVCVVDPGALVGCNCKPDNGRNVGCEYPKRCECLELAKVHESAMTEEMLEDREQREAKGDFTTNGFPKRFAYTVKQELTPHYLHTRDVIYECNQLCGCGPRCKNRLVQHGPRIPLQIFRTENRGWGLRSPVDLPRGSFVAPYLGEVITRSETTRREEEAQDRTKDCYLFDLDKFSGENGDDVTYTMDGEFFGGPTRFMNHSCRPNCRQYVVSLNKYDTRVYHLAFFTIEFVPKDTELTFDYLDLDEGEAAEGEPDPGSSKRKIKCLCGAEGCRGFLFS